MTRIQVHIKVQKHDLGEGNVSSELDMITAIKKLKELSELVGTMRPEKEDIIDKTQIKWASREQNEGSPIQGSP